MKIRELRDNQTYDPQRGSFIVKAHYNASAHCFESPMDERNGVKMGYSNMIRFKVVKD